MELTGNVQGLIDLVGGGSDVEFEQILESGEKIGVITIDNVPTDIYAPEGAEVKVNQVLSSGTKIATIEVDGEGVDLYAPTPEESTSVEVTPIVTSGDHIADIKVNGQTSELYAPKNGIIYSTEERMIGTWINGKTLYRTIYTGLNVMTRYNSWTDIVAAPANMDIYIGSDIIIYESPNGNIDLSHTGLEIGFSKNVQMIQAEYNQNVNIRPINILSILYTKTTD